MTDTARTEIDLDKVVHILVTEYHLDNAFVEQTGGGCATIYAGPTRPNVEEDPTGEHGEVLYAACAGPGSYGWGRKPSTADLVEFYVGPDDREGYYALSAADVGAITEEHVARLIAAQAKKDNPEIGLSADQIDALGLDSTGRGTPAEVIAQRRETEVYVDAANAENRRLIDAGETDGNARIAASEIAGRKAVEDWKQAGRE